MDSEHSNAILVRGHYKALAAGDMATVFGGWHDDIVFHYNGNNEQRGDCVHRRLAHLVARARPVPAIIPQR